MSTASVLALCAAAAMFAAPVAYAVGRRRAPSLPPAREYVNVIDGLVLPEVDDPRWEKVATYDYLKCGPVQIWYHAVIIGTLKLSTDRDDVARYRDEVKKANKARIEHTDNGEAQRLLERFHMGES